MLRSDADGYVSLGDVSRQLLGMQPSRGCRYAYENPTTPNLGGGLRIRSGMGYSSMRIHQDDVDEFVRRVTDHLKAGS